MLIMRSFSVPIMGYCVERPHNGYEYYREFEISVKTNDTIGDNIIIRTRQRGEKRWLKGLFYTQYWGDWDTWTLAYFEGWIESYG